MATRHISHPGHWRVIGAIAAKDIGEAWRNRTLLGVAAGLFVTMLISQALPFLLGLTGRQPVLLVAGPESQLVETLAARDDLMISRRNTLSAATETVASQNGGMLGIVLTEEAEARLLAGQSVALEGITPYATTPAQLEEALATFQAALTETTGGGQADVTVSTVYPTATTGGRPGMAVMTVILVLLLVGMLMVPALMVEEKEDHTLDVLLVSPATPFDIVIGKALAGMAYGLIAATVAALFYHTLIVHWGVAVAGALVTIVFGISLGLLMGMIFSNSASLNLWLSIILLVLMLPVLVQLAPRLASLAEMPVAAWMPTLAMDQILTASMLEVVPVTTTLWSLSAVLLAIGLLLALVVWTIRRSTV